MILVISLVKYCVYLNIWFYHFMLLFSVLDAALLAGRKDKDEAEEMQKRCLLWNKCDHFYIVSIQQMLPLFFSDTEGN